MPYACMRHFEQKLCMCSICIHKAFIRKELHMCTVYKHEAQKSYYSFSFFLLFPAQQDVCTYALCMHAASVHVCVSAAYLEG